VSQNMSNPLEPATTAESAPANPGVAAPATPAAPATGPAIPVHPGPVKAKGGISNRALNLLLGGALVLAVAGIAFAVGRMTAPAATITGGNFPNGGVFSGQRGNGYFQVRGNGQGGIGVFGGGAGPTIEGTVESISGTTLTLKTADGQTIQVALNGSTTYHAQSDASASDVVTGSKVLVRVDFRRGDGAGGPQATAGTGGTVTGPAASDVTVVP
jgi:hypothetical protein